MDKSYLHRQLSQRKLNKVTFSQRITLNIFLITKCWKKKHTNPSHPDLAVVMLSNTQMNEISFFTALFWHYKLFDFFLNASVLYNKLEEKMTTAGIISFRQVCAMFLYYRIFPAHMIGRLLSHNPAINSIINLAIVKIDNL